MQWKLLSKWSCSKGVFEMGGGGAGRETLKHCIYLSIFNAELFQKSLVGLIFSKSWVTFSQKWLTCGFHSFMDLKWCWFIKLWAITMWNFFPSVVSLWRSKKLTHCLLLSTTNKLSISLLKIRNIVTFGVTFSNNQRFSYLKTNT